MELNNNINRYVLEECANRLCVYIYTHNVSSIEKIAFKVVQMKFSAMHSTNQNASFQIFQEFYVPNT